jgi:hypothetical protein
MVNGQDFDSEFFNEDDEQSAKPKRPPLTNQPKSGEWLLKQGTGGIAVGGAKAAGFAGGDIFADAVGLGGLEFGVKGDLTKAVPASGLADLAGASGAGGQANLQTFPTSPLSDAGGDISSAAHVPLPPPSSGEVAVGTGAGTPGQLIQQDKDLTTLQEDKDLLLKSAVAAPQKPPVTPPLAPPSVSTPPVKTPAQLVQEDIDLLGQPGAGTAQEKDWTEDIDTTNPPKAGQIVKTFLGQGESKGFSLLDLYKNFSIDPSMASTVNFMDRLNKEIEGLKKFEDVGPVYANHSLVQQTVMDDLTTDSYTVWGYFISDDKKNTVDFYWDEKTNQKGTQWARMTEQANLYRKMQANLASDMSMTDKKAAIEADMMEIGQALGINRDQMQMNLAADIAKEKDIRDQKMRQAEINLDFIQKFGGMVPDEKELYGHLAGETFEGTLAEGEKQQALQEYIRAKMVEGGEVPNSPEFGLLAGMKFEGEKGKREAEEEFVTAEREKKEEQQNLNAELSVILRTGGQIPEGFGALSGKWIGDAGTDDIESEQAYQERLIKEGRTSDKTNREELAELQSNLDKSETVDAALLMDFLRRGGTVPDTPENREKYGDLAGTGLEKTWDGENIIRVKGSDQTDQEFQEDMLENRQKFEKQEAATARTEESEQQRASQFINSVLETGTQTIPGTGIDIPIGYVQKNGQVVPSLSEERGKELYGDFYGLVVPGRQKWQQQQDHVAWERDWKMQAAKLGLAGSNTDEQLADAVKQKEEADSLDRANFALTIIKQMSENPVFLRYLRDSPLLSQLSQDTGYDFTWISSGGADPAILGEASLPHFADWQALPPDQQSLVLSNLSTQLGVKPADIRSEIVRRASGMGIAFGNRGVAPSRLALGWT